VLLSQQSSLLQESFQFIDRYGFSTFVAVMLMAGFAYALHRTFGKTGWLMRATDRHVILMDTMGDSQATIAKSLAGLSLSAEQAHSNMAARTKVVEGLVDYATSPESPSSNVRLHRSGIHLCDVLEKICVELDVSDKTSASIAAIRRELTEH